MDIKPSNNKSFENITKVVALEGAMKTAINSGDLKDGMDDCILTHHFAPIVDDYGCGTYARELFMPKGTVIVGKIHKLPHLNIISKGKLVVLTEKGKEVFEAPCTFVSPAGLKRAGYIEEDTVWTTIHLTKDLGEHNLHKIENEVIAKTFAEIGLQDPTIEDLAMYSKKELGLLL